MDTLMPVDPAAALRPAATQTPRIGTLGPHASPEEATRAAALGFDTILLPGAHPDLAPLLDAARATGLAVWMDVEIDTVPAAESLPPVFAVAPAPLLDPRHGAPPGPNAVATVTDDTDAETLAGWWAPHIVALAASGIAGVRVMGLGSLPAAAVVTFLSSLRAACPGIVLFAWTPGLPWDRLATLPAGTVDFVASSLPWWDGEADWLWTELGLLRRAAPVIVPAGTHPQLAALMADGWMAPLSEAGPAAAESNAARAAANFGTGLAHPLSGPGAPVTAILRLDAADARQAAHATVALLNPASTPTPVNLPAVLCAAGSFGPWQDGAGTKIGPASTIVLPPGGAMLLTAPALAKPALPEPAIRPIAGAAEAARQPRLAIEAPSPVVDAGRFPVRRTLGDLVTVEADIIADGHDKLGVALQWRAPGDATWQELRMRHLDNDRWTGAFPLERLGIHEYRIQAWRDAFATFADELAKKHAAGVPIALELQEGAALVARLAPSAAKALPAEPDARRAALLSPAMAARMAAADDRPLAATLGPVPVRAERLGASFAAWYEVFPRSLSDDMSRHGTFRDVEHHLPRIRDMGFDVLYFTPFHPIGRTNRKGPNNTLTPAADDPGSPYAIGSEDGGHDALHPELGTLEDFQHLRAAAAEHGLELAMDFAIQCSPDHPWLKQHPDWFTWRPDGTIRYAENPPKRYEDIVNVDFYAEGAIPGLWEELCRAVLFWAGQGVRLFRVDNPHTKPLPFWEWMIATVQEHYPDSLFLAEAFTRPKVMYRLAKAGFSQSYTYFTWRDTKAEFQDYLTELTEGPARDFFRPHFFVNTPDINPVSLQTSGRPGYLIRAALAATLSGLWGVYNGFELCEGTPVPGKEEYLDSEKYQLRAWDWDRPGNIVPEITRLNAIRRANPALHSHLGVTFLPATGDQVLFFEKATPDHSNVILVAINMDPRYAQSAALTLPAAMDVTDLLSGAAARWTDRTQRITLPPDRPYAIWRAHTPATPT